MSIEDGFEYWLSRFVNDKNKIDKDQLSDFDCYHPANYQSKFFTSREQDLHGLDISIGFEPDSETHSIEIAFIRRCEEFRLNRSDVVAMD